MNDGTGETTGEGARGASSNTPALPPHLEPIEIAAPKEEAREVPALAVPPKPGSAPEIERRIPSPAVPPVPEAQKLPPAMPVEPSRMSVSLQPRGKIGDDMAKIIADVRLPERRFEAPKKETKLVDLEIPASEEPRERRVIDLTEKPKLGEQAIPAPTPATAETPTPTPTISGDPSEIVGVEKTPIVPLRTLKDDLQEVVRVKKISLVRAAALEADKKRGAAAAEEIVRPRRSMRGIIVATVLLILLGSAGFGAVYFIMTAQRDGGAVVSDQSLIFSEQTVGFPIDPTQPAREIKSQLELVRKNSGLTLGAITRVVPFIREARAGEMIERPITAPEFLHAVAPNTPEDLLRSLGDSFFMGVHTVDENAPVLVIPVTSYERAFAAMLAWERGMSGDLAPFFTPVELTLVKDGGGVVENQFIDVIMRNYDARALKDPGGTIQLYYSFPTRDLLIIAESPYSFSEILSRLRAERRL